MLKRHDFNLIRTRVTEQHSFCADPDPEFYKNLDPHLEAWNLKSSLIFKNTF
jgi:hypothetical protein